MVHQIANPEKAMLLAYKKASIETIQSILALFYSLQYAEPDKLKRLELVKKDIQCYIVEIEAGIKNDKTTETKP